MRCLVVFAVSLVALFSSCYGQCGIAPGVVQDTLQGRGCLYKGMFMDLGSSVTKDCVTYSCSKDGSVSFCSNGMHIVSHPADCKVIKAHDGCSEIAVKIADESIQCTDGVGAVSRRDVK